MEQAPETPAVFEVKDCAIIVRTAGLDSAYNLRELRERIKICPPESLFHHFCETAIRATFDDPEFRNDFAIWAARSLRDRALAERLGIINPYRLESLEALRERTVDVLDQRLAEAQTIPWAPRGEDFHFLQAATVVFQTQTRLGSLEALLEALPKLSLSSIYYHFVEARRRTAERRDDFTLWLERLSPPPVGAIDALSVIDFYFMSLPELRERLADAGRRLSDVSVAEEL